MNQSIERSEKPITFQLIGASLIGLFLLILATRLFRAIDDLMPWDWSALTKLARIIVMIVIIISLLGIWLNGKKERYSIRDGSVIISKGSLGKKQNIYNAAHITSLSVRQPFFGKRYNYGHVMFHMDKLEQNNEVVLRNVINPQAVAAQLTKLQRKS
jgi:uncharacterized membrane protein YdbT with pleckstrin-like domain